MKICLVVHGVYIAGGVAMLAMMGATKIFINEWRVLYKENDFG